jgi:hypothetical protein
MLIYLEALGSSRRATSYHDMYLFHWLRAKKFQPLYNLSHAYQFHLSLISTYYGPAIPSLYSQNLEQGLDRKKSQ